MLMLRLLINTFFFSRGVLFVVQGNKDNKCGWYPRWIGNSQIVLGILVSICSFIVWFIK